MGGQKFAGNQFFLIDADDLPKHFFKAGSVPDVQNAEAVTLKFLIIADGGRTVKMYPENLPAFGGRRFVIMMIHAVDKETLPV